MNATKKQFRTIDEYIETFPKDVQSILEKNEADNSKSGT